MGGDIEVRCDFDGDVESVAVMVTLFVLHLRRL